MDVCFSKLLKTGYLDSWKIADQQAVTIGRPQQVYLFVHLGQLVLSTVLKRHDGQDAAAGRRTGGGEDSSEWEGKMQAERLWSRGRKVLELSAQRLGSKAA